MNGNGTTHETSSFFNNERRTDFDEGHVQKFAKRNGAAYASLLRARLLAALLQGTAAVAQLVIGWQYRTVACEEPLHLWLLASGGASLVAALCALRGLWRGRAFGTPELQAYLLRRDRGAEEDPSWEQKVAAAEPGDLATALARLLSASLIALFLLGLGLVHRLASAQRHAVAGDGDSAERGDCNVALRGWTVAALGVQILVPSLAFGLSAALCLRSYFRHDPRESYWDDQAVDFW